MRFINFTFAVLFFLSFSSKANAQASVNNLDVNAIAKLEMNIMSTFESYQAAIFETETEDNIIIDFQEIPVNIKTIKVLDREARVIYQDDVQNLPVDALYELDMSQFPLGDYTLQIDSYNSTFFIKFDAGRDSKLKVKTE